MSRVWKWLGKVSAFANAGNLGEFTRELERQAPMPEKNKVVRLMPESHPHRQLHSSGSHWSGKVMPLRLYEQSRHANK